MPGASGLYQGVRNPSVKRFSTSLATNRRRRPIPSGVGFSRRTRSADCLISKTLRVRKKQISNAWKKLNCPRRDLSLQPAL
jgi:hypothetical protein